MMAQESYLKAIASATSPERREELRQQLFSYCHLDTLGILKMQEFFRSKNQSVR